MRNPIAAVADNAIEHLAGGHQRGTTIGSDDLLNQQINERVGDTSEILRSFRSGGSRRKIGPQQGTRKSREAEPLHGDIEVEIIQASAKLNGIDDTQRRLDAERAEILDERHVMRLRRRLIDQELDGDLFALRRHAFAVNDREAGVLKERARLAQLQAVLAGSIGHRRDEGILENRFGDLVTQGPEQGHFVWAWFAHCHHVGILEQGMQPLIGPEHDGLIGPFEIERVDEGLSHTLVLKYLPSRIEEPALYPHRSSERDDVALDAPLANRRKVVARGPNPRRELLPKQIVLRREPLKREVAVAVVFITHSVEVVLAASDRQIGAPPVLDPYILDEATNLELPDLVGAAPERRFECRFVERMAGIVGP